MYEPLNGSRLGIDLPSAQHLFQNATKFDAVMFRELVDASFADFQDRRLLRRINGFLVLRDSRLLVRSRLHRVDEF